jgi:hypothetical protein
MFERVRELVQEEVGELIEAGGVVHAESDRLDVPDVAVAEISLTPEAAGAAPVSMSVWGDTVTFGTGSAGAYSEIWSTQDPEWDITLRDRLRCVRDGRYTEVVSRGTFVSLNVKMRFEGVPSGSGRRRKPDTIIKYGSTLAGVDGAAPMPPTGEFNFSPW